MVAKSLFSLLALTVLLLSGVALGASSDAATETASVGGSASNANTNANSNSNSNEHEMLLQYGSCYQPCPSGHGCPPVRDHCCAISSCAHCVADPSCGWCQSSGTCRSGGMMGPNDWNCTVWDYGFCAGEPCKVYSGCHSCTKDPFCGWCGHSSTCHEGNQDGPVVAQCPTTHWASVTDKCSGGILAQPPGNTQVVLLPANPNPIATQLAPNTVSVQTFDITPPAAAAFAM
eukprot:gnl/Hemi2/26356_TR8842_c0_g1_i1.p1 gnl/Hemi2/26356_TR8842_c0_g1~~gnl/Hemi2/26356_TR8842_c0_g1_i1.p1  ORF type:complete len:231 (-),score=66.25 gnl/Hemi2/26356_TR8842_c0_g1_i1:212-904(-)